MISAIIAAAGESKRMGEPKMLMKWGEGTILSRVISVFSEAGLEDIVVITGSDREKIELMIGEQAARHPVRAVFNPDYKAGGMLSSIQRGLQDLTEKNVGAAMIGLGDQPQLEAGSVRMILDEFMRSAHPLIIPSHQRKRGHPWLVGRRHWKEILEMSPPQTLRDFLNRQADQIRYVYVDTDSILADMDTPDDYLRAKAG